MGKVESVIPDPAKCDCCECDAREQYLRMKRRHDRERISPSPRPPDENEMPDVESKKGPK